MPGRQEGDVSLAEVKVTRKTGRGKKGERGEVVEGKGEELKGIAVNVEKGG